MIEMQSSPLLLPNDSSTDRSCFICLEDEPELVSCCSRCFGVAHKKCWKEWRSSQRLAAARTSSSTRDPFLCSICKTGRARIQGETLSRDWIETVLAAALNRDQGVDDADIFEAMVDDNACCSTRRVLGNILGLILIGIITVVLVQLEILNGASAWLAGLILLTQSIVIQLVVCISRFRASWRERRRPVAALVNEEITERRGTLFPVEVVVT